MQDAGWRMQDARCTMQECKKQRPGVGGREGSSDQIKLLKVFCDRAGGRPWAFCMESESPRAQKCAPDEEWDGLVQCGSVVGAQ